MHIVYSARTSLLYTTMTHVNISHDTRIIWYNQAHGMFGALTRVFSYSDRYFCEQPHVPTSIRSSLNNFEKTMEDDFWYFNLWETCENGVWTQLHMDKNTPTKHLTVHMIQEHIDNIKHVIVSFDVKAVLKRDGTINKYLSHRKNVNVAISGYQVSRK